MGRSGPLPFPLPPLIAAQLQRLGQRRRKLPRPQAPTLGIIQWGTHLYPV